MNYTCDGSSGTCVPADCVGMICPPGQYCRSALLEIISVVAHAASAGPCDSRVSIGPPVFRSFSGPPEDGVGATTVASLDVGAYVLIAD